MTVCRHCGTGLEHVFCDLGMSPLANSYIEPSQADRMEPFYPLKAFVCAECLLVQLDQFESPQHIFGDYAYFSSFSDSWLAHAKAYVASVAARFGLGAQSQVVEIASNDGYLLQYFKALGVPALGIEPAANVAKAAEARGIETWVRFFGPETAELLRTEGRTADLIVGNNVLAHVPALNDFVRGLKLALKPQGVITMEFPHLLALMEENQFDTIYHEHFSYFSFLAVSRIFQHHGLRIFDVEEIPTHGGSLRIYATHADAAHPQGPRVDALLDKERAAGLAQLATYESFSLQVAKLKRQLLRLLIDVREQGKQVVGYGAPAKGNTLLNYCGVRQDLLAYTVDRSPHKQGRLLPGVRVPIESPDKIHETRPDYVLILPWNLRDEIMQQMAGVRAWGGQFIVPIPEPKILP